MEVQRVYTQQKTEWKRWINSPIESKYKQDCTTEWVLTLAYLGDLISPNMMCAVSKGLCCVVNVEYTTLWTMYYYGSHNIGTSTKISLWCGVKEFEKRNSTFTALWNISRIDLNISL